MIISLFIVIAAAGFALQMVLCFLSKRIWVKLVPAVVVLLMDFFCWTAFFFNWFPDIYGAAFAALAYGVLGLLMMGGLTLAWAVYGIICCIKMR